MKKFLFSLIAVLAVGFSASAQKLPIFFDQSSMFITNASLTVGTNSTTIIGSTQHKPMDITPGVGFSFQPIFRGTNESANTNVTFYIALSVDGTTYSTTNCLTYTTKLNGTNPVVGYAEFSPTNCNNALKARLYAITVDNGTNSAVVVTGTRWGKRVTPIYP